MKKAVLTGRAMKQIIRTTQLSAISFFVMGPVMAYGNINEAGNCAIYAEMSAQTVKKDNRFDGHDDVAPALTKFATAQSAKMDANMADTYAQSAAFGWDKAKVDEMIKSGQDNVRAGFFTPTMDTSKLYMDHVQVVYACMQAHPSDLGQSSEALGAVIQKMAKIVVK